VIPLNPNPVKLLFLQYLSEFFLGYTHFSQDFSKSALFDSFVLGKDDRAVALWMIINGVTALLPVEDKTGPI